MSKTRNKQKRKETNKKQHQNKNNKESDASNDQQGCAIPQPRKQILDSYQRTTEVLTITKDRKQLSYEIDRNNSDVMSWEKTKAPGSARDSNSSASERLSLNGLQLEYEWFKQLDVQCFSNVTLVSIAYGPLIIDSIQFNPACYVSQFLQNEADPPYDHSVYTTTFLALTTSSMGPANAF